jgi:hypothetical protein
LSNRVPTIRLFPFPVEANHPRFFPAPTGGVPKIVFLSGFAGLPVPCLAARNDIPIHLSRNVFALKLFIPKSAFVGFTAGFAPGKDTVMFHGLPSGSSSPT